MFFNFFNNKLSNFFFNIEFTSIFFNRLNLINFQQKYWLFYSNIFSLFLITFFIICLGIFFSKKALHIKLFNSIIGFYLIIYFFFSSLNYTYITMPFYKLNWNFNQNISLFANLFIFLATVTTIIFLSSICNTFFSEENTKIEFSLLIWFIFISSIYLIANTDFISTILLLECIAFSTYVLVGFERKNKFSITSALRYLILASIPSGIFILGLSLFYNLFGSFSQDYLQLFLQTFTKSIIQKNFVNNDVFILEMLFKNYLENLNNLLLSISPQNVFICAELEKIFIDSNYDMDSYWWDFYSVTYTQYFLIVYEIFQLKYFWNLIFIEQQWLWKESPLYVWEYLFLQNYTGILEWVYFFNWYENLAFFSFFDFFGLDELYINLYEIPYQLQEIYRQDLYFKEERVTTCALRDFKSLMAMSEILKFKIIMQHLFIQGFELKKNIDFSTENYVQHSLILENLRKFYELNSLKNFVLLYQLFNFKFQTEIIPTIVYNNLSSFAIKGGFYYDFIILPLYLSILFIVVNLCFKLTAAPFSAWAPAVYGGTPLAALTFLSIFSKLTIIFLIIWLFLNIFDVLKIFWQPLFICISFLSILHSILGAFSEKLFKRFFVYSSMSHVGFMLIGIGAFNFSGICGSINYLIIYVISSFIIWFIILHLTKNTRTLINLKNLTYNHPELSMIFSFVIFSLSGIPPLAGFFVKYEIFYSILNSSLFYLGYILLILTVISFFYYLRLIKIIFFEKNNFFYKNKNLNDIKLRIISICFFIIPFFLIYVQSPVFLILQKFLINSLF